MKSAVYVLVVSAIMVTSLLPVSEAADMSLENYIATIPLWILIDTNAMDETPNTFGDFEHRTWYFGDPTEAGASPLIVSTLLQASSLGLMTLSDDYYYLAYSWIGSPYINDALVIISFGKTTGVAGSAVVWAWGEGYLDAIDTIVATYSVQDMPLIASSGGGGGIDYTTVGMVAGIIAAAVIVIWVGNRKYHFIT